MTNLEEMGDGEGFQIVTWDVMNEKKREKLKKRKESYENSGTVILKSINITQVQFSSRKVSTWVGTF